MHAVGLDGYSHRAKRDQTSFARLRPRTSEWVKNDVKAVPLRSVEERRRQGVASLTGYVSATAPPERTAPERETKHC